MDDIQDHNSIAELSSKLAERISKEFISISSLLEGIKEQWNELPEKSEKIKSIAAIDGGSRSYRTRSLSIIFAQAAGRPMGIGFEEIDWEIIRDAQVSNSSLASDLLNRMRERLELTVASNIIEKYHPKYLLLDGSLEGLFRVGIPSRIRIAVRENREIDAELDSFDREIKAYGEVLDEFLQIVKENQTMVIGISKDSYSRNFIPEKLPSNLLTDVSYFSYLFKNKTGYSNSLKISSENLINSNTELLQIWNNQKINLNSEFYDINTCFLKLTKNGIPIRLDFFSVQEPNLKKIISDLLNFTNNQDWFIPPRLAHERAVVRTDVFEALLRSTYNKSGEIEFENLQILIGESRREVTQ
jgi:hypothetical protein